MRWEWLIAGAIGEVIEDFRYLTPSTLCPQEYFQGAIESPTPSKFGLIGKTEERAFPSCRGALQSGNTLLENLMTCSFRHCAFIFCPKHQRGRLLGCSALEATGS
jgi:hypothetical protein